MSNAYHEALAACAESLARCTDKNESRGEFLLNIADELGADRSYHMRSALAYIAAAQVSFDQTIHTRATKGFLKQIRIMPHTSDKLAACESALHAPSQTMRYAGAAGVVIISTELKDQKLRTQILDKALSQTGFKSVEGQQLSQLRFPSSIPTRPSGSTPSNRPQKAKTHARMTPRSSR